LSQEEVQEIAGRKFDFKELSKTMFDVRNRMWKIEKSREHFNK
jgi:hypothetical protein